MIVEALLDFFHGLAVTLFSWCSSQLPSAPGWVADLNAGLDTVLGMIPEPVRWFVPLGPVVAIGLTVAGLLLAAGLIRLGRRVLSLITGGGGNA